MGDFMERFISFILAVALCFGISACGNNETVAVTPEENPIITEEKPIATDERPITIEEIFEFAKILGPYFEIRDGYINDNTAIVHSRHEQVELINNGDSWNIVQTSSSNRRISNMCNRMTRLTGDELETIRQEMMRNSHILNYFDGYRDGNYYIVYGEYTMYYIKYEDSKYTVVAECRIDENREKTAQENVYISEGKYIDIQYTIKDCCLPTDNSKSVKYNEAVTAYNEFLLEKAKETLEYLIDGDPYSTEYETTLKDLNDDGIPEMLTVMQFTYPYRVFSYRNGEVVELVGPLSNGMHGPVGLLENNIYYSRHLSTGGESNYVTYNKDGSQTVDIFYYFSDEYPSHYTRYIAWTDEDRWNDTVTVVYDIEYPPTEEGRQQFDARFEPFSRLNYKELNMFDFEEVYSPYTVDLSVEYSPYIQNIIETNYI